MRSVGLMLLHGLRSAEVPALNVDDILFSEGQFACAVKVGNFVSCRWRQKRFNCSTIMCGWNVLLAPAPHCLCL